VRRGVSDRLHALTLRTVGGQIFHQVPPMRIRDRLPYRSRNLGLQNGIRFFRVIT